MSSNCPKCSAFMPHDRCGLCGYKRPNHQRTVLWIAAAALGAVALLIAVFGIVRPLMNSDARPISSSASAPATTSKRDQQVVALQWLSHELTKPSDTSDVVDLIAVRSALNALKNSHPAPSIIAFVDRLEAYLEPGSKTPWEAVEASAEAARLETPSQDLGVIAAFDPNLLAVLRTGPLLSRSSPRPVRRSGWIRTPSGMAACFLAVQEVTCITQGGTLKVITGNGDIDTATWAGSPWPTEAEMLLPGTTNESPDGQIVCSVATNESITCTAVGTQDPKNPPSITVQ